LTSVRRTTGFINRIIPITFIRFQTVVVIFVLLWLSDGCVKTPEEPAQPQKNYTLRHQTEPYVRTKPIEYRFYLPQNYDPSREWPMFVALHGFGGTGIDCLNWWKPFADSCGFVLLCPSLGDASGGWDQNTMQNTLYDVVQRAKGECHVRQRVFVAGFSVGGLLAQRFAWNYPTSTSAIAILSAVTYDRFNAQAKDIPVLVVVGDADPYLSVYEVRAYADELALAGFSVDLQVLHGVGHQVTGATLNLTMDFYSRTTGKL
jgi:poly(3-hydroxybutyrate) depolymerase